MSLPVVIGLGSHHGDDQAGWLVVKHLRERNFPEAKLACLQHPAELLDMIETNQELVICDACSGNGTPGLIHCGIWTPAILRQNSKSKSDQFVNRLDDELATEKTRPGSHDLSLFEIMEIGYSLKSFPELVEIWTVEGTVWEPGAEPTAKIQSAAVRMADLIWDKYCHA